MSTVQTPAPTVSSELAKYEATLQQLADEERDVSHQQQAALERRRALAQQQANLDALEAGADERIAIQGELAAVDAVLARYQQSLTTLRERRSGLNADMRAVNHRAALVRNDLRQRTQMIERERRDIESAEAQLTTRRSALVTMEQEAAGLRARLQQLVGSIELAG